tara:strand:- start:759 stop:1571 length:813 start_codon:yes stop_codon:yes gene_type:complete
MITAEIDPADQRRLNSLFIKLAKGSKKPIKEVFTAEGRLFAVEASAFTGRPGRKAFVAKKHKADIDSTWKSTYVSRKMIASDISKQYGVRTGRRFYNFMGRHQYGKAQELLDALSFRTSKSGFEVLCIKYDKGKAVWTRIKAKNKSKGRRNHRTVYCLSVMKEMNADMRKAKKLVGSIKKGWWEVARDLGGTRGIPAYVGKAEVTNKGRTQSRDSRSGFTLTMENKSDRASTFFDWGRVWKKRGDVIEKRLQDAEERRLQRIINRENRKG